MQNSGEQTASVNCRCRRKDSGSKEGSALLTRWNISCQILTIFFVSTMLLAVGSMRLFHLLLKHLQSHTIHIFHRPLFNTPPTPVFSFHFSSLGCTLCLISSSRSTSIPQEGLPSVSLQSQF